MDIMKENPAGERLLATKLYVPPWRAVQIARQRLIARLQQGVQCQLTLICAPAGSGKTTLLSEWLSTSSSAHHSSPITAWLSLDKEDNDPVRFWHYVAAALRAASPAIGDDLLDLLQTATSATITPFLTTLINAVSSAANDCVLILDDYHVIHTREVHDTLTFLLDHLPPNMHLFMASRADPPLPLARLRARQQLIELRSLDLRFTHDEAATFLQQALTISLSGEQVTALEMRTEGWIAGLQLAALSLRGRENVSDFIATFTGSHRYIVDYLAEEVLYRLPARVQTFLLFTSILDRLCGPLCDALVDQIDGQEMLEWLEQSNVFLVPLDDARQWYRYHHLFADVLSHRLQRTQPEIVADLHRRASLWYEQHGQPAPAIEHALSGGAFDRAATLVEQAGGELMRQGETDTLLHWLERLPEELVRSHARLCIFYAWTLQNTARWGDAERWACDAERILDDVKEQTSIDVIKGNVMAVRGALASRRGDNLLAIELAQKALKRLGPYNLSQRSYMTLHLALAYWLNGDIEQMQEALLETSRVSLEVGHISVYVYAMYSQAQLRVQQGSLHQAFIVLQQAIQAISTRVAQVDKWLPALGIVHMGIGELYYEWNNLPIAMQHLTAALEAGLYIGDSRMLPYSHMALARAKLAMDDRDGAHETLQKVADYIQENYESHDTSHIAARLAKLYLTLGDSEAAGHWFQECTTLARNKPVHVYEPEDIVMARFFIIQNRPAEALALLQPLVVAAEADGRTGNLIGLLVIQSLALQAQSAITQAIQTLARALSLAEPQGHIRTFVDEGEPMTSLLCEVRAAHQKRSLAISYPVSMRYIDRLLAASGVQPDSYEANGAAQDLSQPLPEPLSERELEILRLIASGLSNQEITECLVIAKSTLKTHINHIYSKLAVRSRTQAVAQARTLKLL